MEFRLTVMSKLFVVLTVLGPFFITVLAILPGALSSSGAFNNGALERIAVAGADSQCIDEISAPLREKGIIIAAVELSAEERNRALEDGEYDGYVLIPRDLQSTDPVEYIARGYLNFRVMGELENAIGNSIVSRRFRTAGVPDARSATIALRPSFEMWRLGKDGVKVRGADFLAILTTGLFFSVSLYMTLVLYGQIIGRSVLMEKTSKTVEIMLSSVRPLELMFGKIFGKAFACLLQLGFWIGISKCVLNFVGSQFGYSAGISLTAGGGAYIALFFVLAYFLFCSVYAALGAASQDEQHLAQLSWPIVALLVIPVMLIKQIIMAPHSPVILGLSLFPFTAPMVMFLRILLNDASNWEIILSVILMLATTAGVIWISSKIFAAGIFLMGKRLDYRGILKLLRNR